MFRIALPIWALVHYLTSSTTMPVVWQDLNYHFLATGVGLVEEGGVCQSDYATLSLTTDPRETWQRHIEDILAPASRNPLFLLLLPMLPSAVRLVYVPAWR